MDKGLFMQHLHFIYNDNNKWNLTIKYLILQNTMKNVDLRWLWYDRVKYYDAVITFNLVIDQSNITHNFSLPFVTVDMICVIEMNKRWDETGLA